MVSIDGLQNYLGDLLNQLLTALFYPFSWLLMIINDLMVSTINVFVNFFNAIFGFFNHFIDFILLILTFLPPYISVPMTTCLALIFWKRLYHYVKDIRIAGFGI